jgi:hypothetical protein
VVELALQIQGLRDANRSQLGDSCTEN